MLLLLIPRQWRDPHILVFLCAPCFFFNIRFFKVARLFITTRNYFNGKLKIDSFSSLTLWRISTNTTRLTISTTIGYRTYEETYNRWTRIVDSRSIFHSKIGGIVSESSVGNAGRRRNIHHWNTFAMLDRCQILPVGTAANHSEQKRRNR
jgi:hypothetical protein